MATMMERMAAWMLGLVPRADLAPDPYGLADDLLRKAQTPEGLLIIGAVIFGAWLVFRTFR